MILVGDSLAMVVLGLRRHAAGHRRRHRPPHRRRAAGPAGLDGRGPAPLVVGDLPWMSYHTSADDAVRNAATLVRAGAQAVKLEGGRKRLPVVEAIVDAEIPVMGHLGLTPQSVHAMGGFKVQGRQHDAALALRRRRQGAGRRRLLRHRARGRARRGGPPGDRRRRRADDRHRRRPRHCDGQVLVYHDVLGIEDRMAPKFVRRYADLGAAAVEGLQAFADDVRARPLPERRRELPPLGRGGRDPEPLRRPGLRA